MMCSTDYQTIGQMVARYVGEAAGIHRWAYRSHHIDSEADLTAPEEYLIDVVLPDNHTSGASYPVLFLGEVAAVPGSRGYGLELAKQQNIHNTYGCILASSTFKSAPWYGTKSDGTRRVDTHIKWNAFPLLEQFYGAAPGREGKLFLGFSKSGWGAVSLILRNPTYFGYAGAWDTPWNITYGQYGTADAFGTETRFNDYNPTNILPGLTASVTDRERLWISAGHTFSTHHASMITQLTGLGVPHRARFVAAPEHEWDADWLDVGCQALFEMRAA